MKELTKGRIALVIVVLVFLVGLAIFSRARTVSSVCTSLTEVTQTINAHDHPALRDFIAANVEARQHTADLAAEEGNFAEARLQHGIAVQYREIGERFTNLPPPTC